MISKELVEIVILVNEVFKDYEKTYFWLTTTNLNFGGCTPYQLINSGRAKKVRQFIVDMKGCD